MRNVLVFLRVVFSGRLFRRIKVFSQYAYYMMLEAISPALSLERPKLTQAPPVGGAAPKDRTSSVELHLVADDNARRRFVPTNEAQRALVSHIPNKFKTAQCFICDGPLTPVIQIIDSDDASDYMERSWCRACDHLQYSVLPSKDWFTAWYGSHWDTAGSLEGKLDIRHPTYRYCHRLAPYIGERKLKILDIGAGYGEKTALFQKAGHELHCTEASAARASYLRDHVTKNVYFGTLDDPAVRDEVRRNGPFDLIFTYHVIEHIYNPRAELQILREIAAKDAIFYLAIPELYKEGVFQYLYTLEHIASFSRTSGEMLLKQTGFRPIVAKDDPFQYYSNYCQYLIGRKAPDDEISSIPVRVADDKMPRWIAASLGLSRIAGLAGDTFGYDYYGRERLTYRISDDSKRKGLDLNNGLPLRIYHPGIPLFWVY